MDWEVYLKLFASLFSICDPIGVVPVFLSLTRDREPAEARRIAWGAAVAMTIVLLTSLIAGEQILGFFGIGIASFQVAGGILLGTLALSMLRAEMNPVRETREEHLLGQKKADISVVPLGIPLLAGPGAISTVIVFAHNADGVAHYGLSAVAIVLVTALCGLTLAASPKLSRLLGQTGVNIVTRVMGLILAAIAVEFLARGLRDLFPVLAGPLGS